MNWFDHGLQFDTAMPGPFNCLRLMSTAVPLSKEKDMDACILFLSSHIFISKLQQQIGDAVELSSQTLKIDCNCSTSSFMQNFQKQKS